MQCEAFERRLQQLLDLRQRPEYDRLLLQHAETCCDCAESLAAQELLFARLGSDQVEEPDDEFTACVVEQALVCLNRVSSSGLKLLVAVGIAALLLLMVVPAWMGRKSLGPSNDVSQMVLALPDLGQRELVQPESRDRGSAGLPAPDGAAALAMLGGADRSPMAGPQSAGRTDMLQMDSLAHALYIDSFGTLLLELPDGTLAPVDQLTGGLRPLASSFSVAFDALRRSFPLGWESRGEKRRASTNLARGEFV